MTVVFDLDGVLSRSDTMAALILARLRTRPWRAVPVVVLAVAAAIAPATGPRRPRCNRAIVHTVLAGMDAAAYRRLALATARRLAAREGNTSSTVVSALRRAHHRGEAVVTTATERGLARAYLRELGVGDVPLHASEFLFDRRGPRFLRHNVGPAKVKSLRRSNPASAIDTLYTDSASDLPLARRSARVVLVGGSSRSRRTFERSGVPVVLEPWPTS